jgi:hypothetical protein
MKLREWMAFLFPVLTESSNGDKIDKIDKIDKREVIIQMMSISRVCKDGLNDYFQGEGNVLAFAKAISLISDGYQAILKQEYSIEDTDLYSGDDIVRLAKEVTLGMYKLPGTDTAVGKETPAGDGDGDKAVEDT